MIDRSLPKDPFGKVPERAKQAAICCYRQIGSLVALSDPRFALRLPRIRHEIGYQPTSAAVEGLACRKLGSQSSSHRPDP